MADPMVLAAAPAETAELKLSKLQRFMLERARENHTKEGRTLDQPDGADLYVWEVLAGFYGFDTKGMNATGGRQARGTVRRTSVTAAQIRTAEAAISRAARRLEERGMVRRSRGNRAGIRLAVRPESADRGKSADLS